MKKLLKGLLIIAMVFCVMPSYNIAAKADTSSGDNSNQANQDAPVIDDISGINIDFSIPTPTPDPLDTKLEVVAGDYSYKLLDDGTAIITHYSGTGGDVTIPGTIDGYIVTALGDSSFNQCSIESVKLPDSLTLIGADALGANQLKNITIPKNVTYVDTGAFVVNQELKNVTVSSSNTTFGWGVFEFCSGDLTIYAPKGSPAESHAKENHIKFSATSTPLAAPGSFTVKKASATSIKCTWKAVSGASGYQVYSSTSAKGTFRFAGSTTTGLKLTKSSLKLGSTYYFKARAYKIVDGKKVYGKFTNVLKIKM